MNLIESLQACNNKNRQFLAEIAQTEKLLGTSEGLLLARSVTKSLLEQTEQAIADSDMAKMVKVARMNGLADNDNSCHRW